MYLWDSNILRYYFKEHPTLLQHMQRVSPKQIALPSIVVAEALRGRCDYILKAAPEQVQTAERLLSETIRTIQGFAAATFDVTSLAMMKQLLKQHQSRGRYADLMIAAIARAGHHIVVTRNTKDFADLLPGAQLQNWMDDAPTN